MKDQDADVIVVGAGPAGSAAAVHAARAGLAVTVLEKSTFPREKVCGDGLTPRAVKELDLLGIDTSELDWVRTHGLRIHVGTRDYRLDWPKLHDFPQIGMTCRRSVFDEYLANHAVACGATVVQGCNVTGPVVSDRGRVVGVVCKDGRTFRAPIVVEASGNSARLAVCLGLHRMTTRPMGVAVRAYFRSPKSDAQWLDSWLELWDGQPGRSHLLPGYGWSFPLGDGTCNVGLGLPDATRFRDVNLRDLMARWLRWMPEEWGFVEANQVGPVRSAALPMGFNRKPTYSQGLLLLGDAAGAINPFNGEGISYAMESARFAMEAVVDARQVGFHTRRADELLRGYSQRLTAEWGGYFWLGNLFGRIISHPSVMRAAAHWGLPIPVVRQLTHRMLAHLSDKPPKDAYSAVMDALVRIVPRA